MQKDGRVRLLSAECSHACLFGVHGIDSKRGSFLLSALFAHWHDRKSGPSCIKELLPGVVIYPVQGEASNGLRRTCCRVPIVLSARPFAIGHPVANTMKLLVVVTDHQTKV